MNRNARDWLANALIWFGGTLFGTVAFPTVISIVFQPLVEQNIVIGWATASAAIIITGIGLRLRPKAHYSIKLTDARVLSHEDASRQHRRALIALVSNYASRAEPKPDPTEITRALHGLDLPALHLETSNLWPLAQTLQAYQTTLEHCWLITTPESLPSAKALVHYAKTKLNMPCLFHLGSGWSVSKPFTAQVVNDIKDVVELALEQARKAGLPSNSIVTDVTGGTVPMSLGATLACLHPMLDVQYTAMPTVGAALEPLVFRFEPVIAQGKE